MLRKVIQLALLVSFALLQAQAALAASIDNIRSSISPARVRFVLDSKEPIAYKVDKDGAVLTIELPKSSAEKMQPKVNDAFIKSVKLTPDGKNASKLTIKLAQDAQYKIYKLEKPDRLVIDIFRINILKTEKRLDKGVTYTYLQDEMNGRQVQAYLVSVAPDADYEWRPFSAAGTYNGRGYVSKEAAKLKLRAAVNASYFDRDGWVIGTTKDRGEFISTDVNTHSGYIDNGRQRMIAQDIAYNGRVILPGGKALNIKGMNRVRITDDLVLFNEYYAPTTKTNAYGREIKIKNGRVIAVSTRGNMAIEPGSVVLSGHGVNAAALAGLRVGDKVMLTESLGSVAADKAKIVVGAGPLLLENGRVNVRSKEENIAPDIANGRAPRTAVGIKKDGTVLMLVVDGRSKTSAGMTLTELAQYFLRLGARDAVNFDGGGSSVMVINKQIVNHPSDGRERAVSIGLGLFEKTN